jgi:hypothetical protein
MRNNRTNKPFRNFQKKKYYTNRNKLNRSSQAPEIEYFYDPLKKEWGSRIVK